MQKKGETPRLVLVKTLINIASRVLLAYFMALPILVGAHSVLHDHHASLDQDNGIEISQIADCLLCDLYHDQTATTSHSDFNFEANYSERAPFTSIDDPAIADTSALHLRGPPSQRS